VLRDAQLLEVSDTSRHDAFAAYFIDGIRLSFTDDAVQAVPCQHYRGRESRRTSTNDDNVDLSKHCHD
jgi:hypothetical protein